MTENRIIGHTRIIERQQIGRLFVDSCFFFAFSKENRIMEHKRTVTLPYLCNLPFTFYKCGTSHMNMYPARVIQSAYCRLFQWEFHGYTVYCIYIYGKCHNYRMEIVDYKGTVKLPYVCVP